MEPQVKDILYYKDTIQKTLYKGQVFFPQNYDDFPNLREEDTEDKYCSQYVLYIIMVVPLYVD